MHVADNFLSVQPKTLEVGPSCSETLFESFGPSSERLHCTDKKLYIMCKSDMHVALSFVRVDRGDVQQKSLVMQCEKSHKFRLSLKVHFSNDAL